jgi:hypothetical protein
MEPNPDHGSLTADRFTGVIFFFEMRPTTKLCLPFKLTAGQSKKDRNSPGDCFLIKIDGFKILHSENP